MTTFTEYLKHYIAERRHYGGEWTGTEWNLRPFAAFADAEGAESITVRLFLRWKEQFGSASSVTWNQRLSAVRGFTAWLKDRDPRTEVPPKGLIPKRYQRPAPYIYSDGEIVRIVTEAAKLQSPLGLTGSTLATLFGLVAVTGLRISEVIGLDDLDIDLDAAVLHVRNAKHGKSRFIPVTDCTADRLRTYRGKRNRVLGTAPTAFFTSECGKRLGKQTVWKRFAKLGQAIGLREKRAGYRLGRGPRLQDMRHSFATKTIIDWLQAGRDPDREMYKLTTYLGHADPGATYWYIEAVPKLLHLASERAERCFREGGTGS